MLGCKTLNSSAILDFSCHSLQKWHSSSRHQPPTRKTKKGTNKKTRHKKTTPPICYDLSCAVGPPAVSMDCGRDLGSLLRLISADRKGLLASSGGRWFRDHDRAAKASHLGWNATGKQGLRNKSLSVKGSCPAAGSRRLKLQRVHSQVLRRAKILTKRCCQFLKGLEAHGTSKLSCFQTALHMHPVLEVMNRFTVKDGCEQEFEQRWAKRESKLQEALELGKAVRRALCLSNLWLLLHRLMASSSSSY